MLTEKQLAKIMKILANRYEKSGVSTGNTPIPPQEPRTIEERLTEIERRLSNIERDLLPYRKF